MKITRRQFVLGSLCSAAIGANIVLLMPRRGKKPFFEAESISRAWFNRDSTVIAIACTNEGVHSLAWLSLDGGNRGQIELPRETDRVIDFSWGNGKKKYAVILGCKKTRDVLCLHGDIDDKEAGGSTPLPIDLAQDQRLSVAWEKEGDFYLMSSTTGAVYSGKDGKLIAPNISKENPDRVEVFASLETDSQGNLTHLRVTAGNKSPNAMDISLITRGPHGAIASSTVVSKNASTSAVVRTPNHCILSANAANPKSQVLDLRSKEQLATLDLFLPVNLMQLPVGMSPDGKLLAVAQTLYGGKQSDQQAAGLYLQRL